MGIERNRNHLRYFIGLTVFLCYLAAGFMVFSASVDRAVKENTVELLHSNVEQQSYHFEAVIELQFKTLESAASYISLQPDRISQETMEQILHALSCTGTFGRTMLILPDGTGYSSDGAVVQLADRMYFKTALAGERAISQPLSSMVDGDSRVVLAVPVYREGEICAVLGGSYDVGALSSLLFADIYGGKGISFVVSVDGTVVNEGSGSADWLAHNLFDTYGGVDFSQGSLEQMRADFAGRRSGSMIVKNDGVGSYLVYCPLDYNGWMLCYVIGEEAARASYMFITHYELLLGGAFLLGVGALLLSLQQCNARDRRRLMRKAAEDLMTGLLNKESTKQSIDEWLAQAHGKGHQVLLMIDLDHFKDVNDTFGHAVGDQVLKEVAMVVRSTFRETDIVGRVGGDEFMVLMKDVSDMEAVERLMGTLNSRVHSISVGGIPSGVLTCSIGAACYPQHGRDFTLLYENADRALYEVKRAGRNGHCVFEPET